MTSLAGKDNPSGSTGRLEPRSPGARLKAQVEETPAISRSIVLCAFYGTVSVTITFFNKAVFSVYGFHFPCFVTLMQIMVCLTFLTFAGLSGLVTLPRIKWETARLVFPLAFCWWVYVVSGIAALRYLSIPMFATLRRCTALVVLVLESLVLGKTSRFVVWLSIVIMVSGGVLAGLNDLAFNFTGYVLVLICCVSTALYLIMIVHVGKRSKLETFGLLMYNNLLAFPMMLTYLFLFTTEWKDIPYYPHIHETRFWLFLLFSAAQATLLNIAIFLCTKLNSPLATTVTGQMKDFVTVGFGLFVFGDVTLHLPNLLGLAVSMAGSVMFALVKFLAIRAEQKRQKYEKEEGSGTTVKSNILK